MLPSGMLARQNATRVLCLLFSHRVLASRTQGGKHGSAPAEGALDPKSNRMLIACTQSRLSAAADGARSVLQHDGMMNGQRGHAHMLQLRTTSATTT